MFTYNYLYEYYCVRKQRYDSYLNRCICSVYYSPAQTSEEDLVLMRLLDEEYTRHPFYGSRKMTTYLHDQGYLVNRKRSSD